MFNWDEPTNNEQEHTVDCRYVGQMMSMDIYWHEQRELNLEDPESIERLEKKIAEIKPVLVIIDPLYSAVSSKDYMSGSAQKMLALKRIRDKHGCSFVIAHHTTKSASKSAGERVGSWGSTFLDALIETGWQIRQSDNDMESVVRLKRHFKDSHEPDSLKLTFEITDRSFGVQIETTHIGEVTDRVMQAILSGQHSSYESITRAARCSKRDVGPAIEALGATKERNGYYEMPDF